MILNRTSRPKLPAIMVGEASQNLIQDVLEQRDLFWGFPRIAKRIVAWGADAAPQVLPHSAVAFAEKDLLERIKLKLRPGESEQRDETEWTIATSTPLPFSSKEVHFGSRTASASAVTLRAEASADACWVESLENGWLFLLPAEERRGWLLAVGDPSEVLLAESRLVSKQIAEVTSPSAGFSCHPRIAHPLCGPGWLACGTAALAFDPICGDGAGNATREAILAAAVIEAACRGGDVASLLAHYRARLLAGFSRHLLQCEQFYQSGHRGAWWKAQLECTRLGLEWCASQQKNASSSQYRLTGFALESLPQ